MRTRLQTLLLAVFLVAAVLYGVSATAGCLAETRVGGYQFFDAASHPATASQALDLQRGIAFAGYDSASECSVAAKNTPKVFGKEKQALVDRAKADKRTGITKADMEAYKELNKELPDPFPGSKVRGPETHPAEVQIHNSLTDALAL